MASGTIKKQVEPFSPTELSLVDEVARDGSFTIQETGWYRLVVDCGNGDDLTIKINGFTIYYQQSFPFKHRETNVLPLAAGDVVSYEASHNNGKVVISKLF